MRLPPRLGAFQVPDGNVAFYLGLALAGSVLVFFGFVVGMDWSRSGTRGLLSAKNKA
jgi:hypothetical protein